ncbi:hypothetical protein [Mahella australiensis]|uniref:Holin n=1 Tax=Mahella australiensis (strain DSM 15567 / CIP 107919 / 50-1 BON) TaxID=697281 RepID=F3ZXA5_MAHA5|nr:hypothetical protein [Mahella australiensis]AEE96562.1 hypothetical protein Mahau_1368 [Mahella australiensis 50-1 BON]
MQAYIGDIAIVPIIMGITEVFKALGMPAKYGPLMSWIIGLVIGFMYIAPQDPATAFVVGSALGLSAAGLYESGKTVYLEMRNKKNADR